MIKRVLGLLVFAAACEAQQIPSLINYQGRLIDGTNIVNGTVDMALRLYDASSGGSVLYEDSSMVLVSDGLYSTFLGDDTTQGSLSDALLHADLYLEVSINGTALSPRERVAANAYALMAQTLVDGAALSELSDDDGAGSGLDADLLDGMDATAFATGTPVYVESDPEWIQDSINYYTRTEADLALVNEGQADSITTAMLTNDAVTSAKILNGTIVNADINSGAAIAAIKIANTALVQNTIFAGDVAGVFDNLQIAANAVGTAEITNSAVTSAKILDGSLTDSDIAINTFWQTSGNAGTVGGTHFIGTTDNQVFDIRVNNQRAFRVEPNASGPNIIGGGANNIVGSNSYAVVISGGNDNEVGTNSSYTAIGGGNNNSVASNSFSATIAGGGFHNIGNNADFATIAGGIANNMGNDSAFSTIAGGAGNDIGTNSASATIAGGEVNNIGANSAFTIIAGGISNDIGNVSTAATIAGGNNNDMGNNSDYATIVGGSDNNVGTNAQFATIAGGDQNTIGPNSSSTTIAGGRHNAIGTNSDSSAILSGNGNIIGNNSSSAVIIGGFGNDIEGNSDSAIVVGGSENLARGNYTFAAGYRAQATNTGSFVWADSNGEFIGSTNNNSWTVRCTGGARFITAINGSGTPTAFALLSPGSGSWTAMSDVHAKENFKAVDGLAILNHVVAMPIQEWNYKTQDDSVRHIGPMSQDFHAAFGVGDSPTGITGVDADGVALAAIQGLYKTMQKEIGLLRQEIQSVREENEQLRSQMIQARTAK